LLVFTDPGCGPCRVVLPEVAVWERQYEDELKVVVVAEGQPEAMRAKRDELELGTVLMQAEREVAEAYRAYGTPSGVLVSPDGRIASPLASGPAAIKELVEGAPPPRLTIQQAQPAGLAAGSDAPDFDLPLADEGRLSLTDLRGRRTLLLFWNPACGFCQGMTPELERWLRDPPPGAPEIVLISRGSAEEHGSLNARVAVDDSFAVGSAYGVRGTPMAVMVSEDGKVASPVLAGQTAIMRALEVHEQVSHV
jgi:thiol-disulfide isomerase/thioredoxin